jgi:hypothetical protein
VANCREPRRANVFARYDRGVASRVNWLVIRRFTTLVLMANNSLPGAAPLRPFANRFLGVTTLLLPTLKCCRSDISPRDVAGGGTGHSAAIHAR